MSADPTPHSDDAERLAVLDSYDILDTPAEEGFDDIVLLASQACQTPVALVSLVAKDRQWFKARRGFSLCETPLAQSVCAHALHQRDVLIIPDLTLDPRTRDNTLVTGEPRIRFYAGAPLHGPQGHAIGTLCVIDKKPRPRGLTSSQRAALQALARQVMMQLELRRAVENREQALAARTLVEEQMRLAVEATGIGIFDFDIRTGELRWDTRVRALFGVPERVPVTYAGTFLGGLHPEDRERADAAVQAALDPVGPRMFDIEYRVIAGDTGAERWLAARGQAIVENGATVRFIGTVRDVSQRKNVESDLRATEERYRMAARATSDAIWDWNLVSNQVLWNEALATAHGHVPDAVEPTGDWWLAHIHPDDRARISDSIHAVIDGGGETWTDEYRFLQGDGGYAAVIDRGYVDPGCRRPCRSDDRRDARHHRAQAHRGGARGSPSPADDRDRDHARRNPAGGSARRPHRAGQSAGRRHARPSARLRRRSRRPSRLSCRRSGGGGRRVSPGPHHRRDSRPRRIGGHYQRHDGSRRWIQMVGEAIKDVSDGTVGAVIAVSDIEDRKRTEAQQDILNRELGHRLKNTLAMVQAIATQTLRNVVDIDEAKEALSARLVAMGKAHDILLSDECESADLHALLDRALSIHDDEPPRRFQFGGPRITVGSKAGLSLTLMMHELATNAVKYGALSLPGGSVSVRWRIEGSSHDAMVHLCWSEQGGPPVMAPTRRGFGSRLIERGLIGAIGGEVTLTYLSTGVVCTAVVPRRGLEEL